MPVNIADPKADTKSVIPVGTRNLVLLGCYLLGVMASFLVGCSSGKSSTSKPATTQNESKETSGSQQPATPPSTSRQTARSDGDGQKWVGDIPYDVFYDQPLSIAADSEQVAMTIVESNTNTEMSSDQQSNNSSQPPEEQTTSSSGGQPWGDVIPAIIVTNEAKRIRNELTKHLRSVGTYNRAYQEVQTLGGTLAAMGAIASMHEGDISWKENAIYVRDLAATVSYGADATGRTAFEKVQLPYEKIIVIFDGSTPPELPESEQDVDLSNVADRGFVMRRMQQSYDWLKRNVQNEDDFTSKKADIQHEAFLLAGLTKIVATDGYAYADEKAYQGFADKMIQNSIAVSTSTETGNLEEYQTLINETLQACDACHFDYRFE